MISYQRGSYNIASFARLDLGLQLFKKSCRYNANFFSLKNTPFEDTSKQNGTTNTEENKDLNDLNNMYNQMFQETEDLSKKMNNLKDDSDDLDLINEEMNEFFGVNNSYKNDIEIEDRIEIRSAKEFIDIVRSKDRFCLISKSSDPIYNLSLEDYIFRNTPINKQNLKAKFISERLLMYINNKTCVFGKNQNPFKELNLKSPLLKSNGGDYDLIRRFSGGGTVIHDLGNVNYSFLTSRNQFDKKYYNSCIINLVNNYILSKQNLEVSNTEAVPLLMLNERGDITCDGFKISGSAYKIAMNKSYHHGTMLIDSDLNEFSKLMRPKLIKNENAEEQEEFTECNDVDSVRAKISNLKDLTKGLFSDTKVFLNLLSKGFSSMFINDKPKIYAIDPAVVDLNEVYSIDKNDNKSSALSDLQSDSWAYLQTPDFKYTNKVSGFYYKVRRGLIIETNDTKNVKINETKFDKKFLI